MNKKNIPIIVQLKQNNNYIVRGINQGDAGILFDMKVMDGIEEFDFSGYSVVTLKIIKPDGTFYIDSNGGDNVDIIDPEHGRLKLNVPTSCTAQEGMHFASIGFSNEDTTYFETATFNYYIGEVINPDNGDIMGTDEYPVLNNLIALVGQAVSEEDLRIMAEAEREAAEENRATEFAQTIEELNAKLDALDDALSDAQSMLNDVLEAFAEGASISIADITALAPKTWVQNKLDDLDYGDTDHEKTNQLVIYHGDAEGISDLADGELGYAMDTNQLFVGNNGSLVQVNDPCFLAQSAAPTNTDKLWIDTSGQAPVIKYHDGTEWVSCNTAVFA